MKKMFGGILLLSILALPCIVSAKTEVALTDLVKGEVTVTIAPETTKKVNILVLNPTIDEANTLVSAESNPSLVQYQNTFIGSDNIVFNLNLARSGIDEGNFLVYVSGDEITGVEKHSIYFASFDTKLSLAKEIYTATDVDTIVTKLTEGKYTLGLDFTPFNSIDIKPLAVLLKASFSEKPIDFYTKDESTLEAALIEMQGRIKKNAVLECFNQRKSSVIYSESGEFLYTDILDVTDIDTGGVTLYSLYNGSVNSDGQVAVRISLLGQSCTSLAMLRKVFAKNIILNGIKYNISGGYSFVSDLVTTENAKLAGISTPTFLGLSDKSAAGYKLVKNKSTLTLSNLAEKIESYSTEEETSTRPKSSSSSGSTSSSYTAPIDTSSYIKDQSVAVTSSFNDIDDVIWASEAINYLSNKGIISGNGNGEFVPNDNITREQTVKMMCLAFGVELTDEKTDFCDVKANEWYSKYISSAKKANIISGIEASVFGVGKSITREDFAAMIYRTMAHNDVKRTVSFSDEVNISEYALEAVKYLKQAGIISGYDDGSFKPKDYITRAEAAKIIYTVIGGKK